MVKVAFLGPRGTYTHQAVIQEFGDRIEVYPQTSIGECFKAVDSKQVDYTVVPFENSTNGQVVFTYDLIRDWYFNDTIQPKFRIVGEQFVSIHHNLLSMELDVNNITKIYSHPQVWGQVTNFLTTMKTRQNGDGNLLVTIDTSSTSKAADLVKLSREKGVACISSTMCSKLYNLPIVKANIEDNQGNTTRFLILGHQPLPVKNPQGPHYVTFIVFTVNQDQEPGSLCGALSIFQQNQVNLLTINSRPSHEKNWHYAFFVEAEGNYEVDDNLKRCIEQLKDSCSHIVTLGAFEREINSF